MKLIWKVMISSEYFSRTLSAALFYLSSKL